jgi:flagellar hook assembly protein FlgD
VFPNPIREEATIELSLREEASVSLDVFDLTGRRVGTILDGVQPAGVRLVRWDGRGSHGAGLAPGIYILRLQAGDLRQSRRVMLVH